MNKALIVLCVAAAAAAGCAREAAVTTPVESVAVPDFTLPDLEGKSVTLSSFKDASPVLLVFWATWCPYCIEEMPELVRLQNKYGDRLKVLAIDVQESRPRVASFVSSRGITLTVLLDEEGDVSRAYGVMGVPTLVVVGKDGMGVLADNRLTREILAAVEKAAS